MSNTDFGKRLAELRKKRGYSQVTFAAAIKVSKSTVGMWETGDREPDNETLQKLADFFDVSVDYLLGRTDDPSPPEKKREPDELESIFFYEWDKLSEEDKQKALEHIRFLRYLAEQENKKK